jgi:hypothetical protein
MDYRLNSFSIYQNLQAIAKKFEAFKVLNANSVHIVIFIKQKIVKPQYEKIHFHPFMFGRPCRRGTCTKNRNNCPIE